MERLWSWTAGNSTDSHKASLLPARPEPPRHPVPRVKIWTPNRIPDYKWTVILQASSTRCRSEQWDFVA